MSLVNTSSEMTGMSRETTKTKDNDSIELNIKHRAGRQVMAYLHVLVQRLQMPTHERIFIQEESEMSRTFLVLHSVLNVDNQHIHNKG